MLAKILGITTLATLGIFAVHSAGAAVLQVAMSAPDVLATDGVCSLREAIINANGDAATWPDCGAGSGADTIRLAGHHVLSSRDLYVSEDLTLRGAGAETTIIDANGASGVLSVTDSLSVDSLTITGGAGGVFGGGIYFQSEGTLSITNSTISMNTAPIGGGIFSLGGQVMIESSTISGNIGAGIVVESGLLTIESSTISGNIGSGGGIVVAGGLLTIDSSTISGNQAFDQGGGVWIAGNRFDGPVRGMIRGSSIVANSAPHGGGVWIGAYDATVTLLNSTVSGNHGGGIVNEECVNYCYGTDTQIQSSTVSGNFGGGIAVNYGSVSLQNSVIAAQVSGADCTQGPGGSIYSSGHNIASDGSCNLAARTDLPNTDPMLDELQNNGGPTLTHALLLGSPAIDAIPMADCSHDDDGEPGTPEVPLTEDQRGVARPQGAGCDIGAYEVPTTPTTPPTTTSSTTLRPPQTTTTTLPRGWKLVLCHIRNEDAQKTLLVASGRTERHLAHGDFLGECPGSTKVVLCHVNRKGRPRTLLLLPQRAQWHLDHGDAQGECTFQASP